MATFTSLEIDALARQNPRFEGIDRWCSIHPWFSRLCFFEFPLAYVITKGYEGEIMPKQLPKIAISDWMITSCADSWWWKNVNSPQPQVTLDGAVLIVCLFFAKIVSTKSLLNSPWSQVDPEDTHLRSTRGIMTEGQLGPIGWFSDMSQDILELMYIYIYVFIYTYSYIYIYTYIYTYMHSMCPYVYIYICIFFF